MKNIKAFARKYHMVLGIIFAIPLLFSATTACLFVIFDEIFHNEAMADYIIKFHTLEIIGLEDVYPFIFLTGIIGLIITAIILLKKPSKS